jgi:hypothetical protein
MVLLLAGCGGDDENPPIATAIGESTPGPASPSLDAGVARLAEGTFSVALVQGAVSGFDPIDLPLERDAEPPPCSEFVFTFAWQVGEADGDAGTGLVWRLTEMGAAREIGSGPVGSVTVGCGFIEAMNSRSERISVNVRYLIGRRGE